MAMEKRATRSGKDAGRNRAFMAGVMGCSMRTVLELQKLTAEKNK
jgi:hypothetical protein